MPNRAKYRGLKTYESCAYRTYIAKVKRVYEEAGPAAERGSRIHGLAEQYVKGELGEMPKELQKFASQFEELKELFDQAQSSGKIVVVNSWIKYCTSCASQMKVLNKAKNEFDNIEYFTFEITNKEVAKLLNVQYQTTLLIFKDNKEIYRSIGETSREKIYKAIKSSI